MGITAEYASGSSGAPVLNQYRRGRRDGGGAQRDASDDPKKDDKPARPQFALSTKTLSRFDQPKDDPKKDDKPKPPEKPGDKGSPQQMVVKMAVPVPVLHKWIGK